MNEILNLTVNEMPQTEFDCSCGRHHNFSVHEMSIRKGAIEDLPKMAEPFKDGKILVVFDNNTYKVAGKKAVELLKENGYHCYASTTKRNVIEKEDGSKVSVFEFVKFREY